MPVKAADTEITYTGDGVSTAFPFPFEVAVAGDFAATLDGSTTTAYSLSGLGVDTGGTCTFSVAPSPGAAVVLYRNAAYDRQLVDYQSGGEFAADTVDADMDRTVMLTQQLATLFGRSLRGPRGTPLNELPSAASRANTTLYFDASGQPTVVNSTGSTSVSLAMQPVVTASTVDVGRAVLGADYFGASNVTFAVSANAGALTIALKGNDGNDHSAGNPGYVSFNGTEKTLTSALSLTIPSTATLGAIANIPFRVWVVLCYRAALTPSIGVINPLKISAGFPADQTFDIEPLSSYGQTPSYDVMSIAADSPGFIYESGITATIVDLQYAVLGYIDFTAGLATPGTWIAGTPWKWAPGVPLPGQPARVYGRRSSAVATGATVLPIDDTIPQNTEGVSFMSATDPLAGLATLSSPCNLLHVTVEAELASSNTDTAIAGAIFLNSDANAAAVALAARPATANVGCHLTLDYIGPNVDASVVQVSTVTFRAGTASAGTTTFNGSAGVRRFGGKMSSQMICQEIMT